MTLLVGQNGSGWTPASANLSQPQAGDTFYYRVFYTAVVSGTMTTAHFQYFDTGATGSNIKVVVYDNSNNLVGTSAAIAKVAGDQTGAISGSISAGLTYKLVVVPDTGRVNAVANSGSGSTFVSGATAAHFSYASPPASLPADDYTNQGQEFVVWIDGTSSGAGRNGAQELMGMGS